MVLCTLFFFVTLSFLSLFVIFFSSCDRAYGSTAARSKVTFCSAVPPTISVQSRTREIARSSHGIKYSTKRVDVYVYILPCRALNQSCSIKEPRRAAVSAPPSRRGRRSRKRAAGPGPAGYNLYTKINAFETLNKRIVQNVTLFVPYTEIPFCLFICTKYVALRAALESTVYGPILRITFSSLSLSVFFLAPLISVWHAIFKMHSQSSSTIFFALALTELQSHAERLGSPYPTVGRWSFLVLRKWK